MIAGCLMCGRSTDLTRHHLLKKGGWRRMGFTNPPLGSVVGLCRTCHDRLHKGFDEDRAAATVELRAVLSDSQRALLDAKPLELWQRRLVATTGGSAATDPEGVKP